MKKIYTFLAAILLFINLQAQLSYTESSNGLQNLTMEGGRCIIQLGDINNDGHLDLITLGDHGNPQSSSSGEKGLMTWKGNGTGTSWTFSKTNGTYGYGGVCLGDVNNDGKVDLGIGIHHNATSGFASTFIDVGLGSGSGTFATSWGSGLATAGEQFGMFGVDFGDINNDGYLDIASNCIGYMGGVQVYRNNGNGTWTHSDGGTGFNSSFDAYLGDLDNDGFNDLIVASNSGTTHFNDKAGKFNAKLTGLPAITTQSGAVNALSVGDVNNDGAKDIAFSNNGVVGVYTYNKSQSKWLALNTGLPTTADVLGVWICDMNIDGNNDVILYQDSTMTVYTGNGSGSWTKDVSINTSKPMFNGISTGDVDHDGYPDILIVARNAGDYLFNNANRNRIKLYRHNSSSVALSISPMFPHGGECFKNNSAQFIDWYSGLPTGTSSTVKIEYSTNGNNGPWTTIAAAAKNNGRYQWSIPASINSNFCMMKFTVDNGSGPVVAYSKPFMIGACSSSVGVFENTENNLSAGVCPNPAAEYAAVMFGINKTERVIIFLQDALGRDVLVIANGEFMAGENRVDINTSGLNSGTYFCTIKTESNQLTKRLVIVK